MENKLCIYAGLYTNKPLKPLTGKVNNTDLLVTMQSSAKNPWLPACM